MYINGQKVTLKRFSSGELKLKKSHLNSFIKDNKVNIIYNNEESFLELMLIINYYINNSTKVNLTLSYLPYQRMDHRDTDELNTVDYMANILNSINLNCLTICEPHCEIDIFKNAKEFSFISALKSKVFKEINFNENTDTIILTDKGGLKRYGNFSKNVVYFNKERDKTTGLISKHNIASDINPSSKCLIVDDIISSGDTMLNIVDYLTSLNIKDIYILCGHFEKNKYNKRLSSNKNIKKIFSTNSLTKRQTGNLKLYNTKEIISWTNK